MEIRYREVRLMRFDTTDISTSIKIAFRRIPAAIMSYIHYFHAKKLYTRSFFCPLSVTLILLVTR